MACGCYNLTTPLYKNCSKMSTLYTKVADLTKRTTIIYVEILLQSST